MTDYTANYGWALPEPLDQLGFPEWANEVNQNFGEQDTLFDAFETQQANIDQRVTTNRNDIEALDPNSDTVVSEADLAQDANALGGVEPAGYATAGHLHKTMGGLVNGDHPDFASAQAAIDYCDTNDLSQVVFGRGTYDPIVIPNAITVVGAGPSNQSFTGTKFLGTDTTAAIDCTGSGIVLRGLRAETPTTGTANALEVNGTLTHVERSMVGTAGGDGLLVAGDENRVTGVTSLTANINGMDCRLTGNNNTVFGNMGLQVSDQGTENQTGVNS